MRVHEMQTETKQKVRLEKYQEANSIMKVNSNVHDLAFAGKACAPLSKEMYPRTSIALHMAGNFAATSYSKSKHAFHKRPEETYHLTFADSQVQGPGPLTPVPCYSGPNHQSIIQHCS